ncbi:hypothetical protein [Hyphomicrobium sp. DMF-1]|uniref:hypothetical protein n=1 Tax=Hyphomicrobium sp. DMF-1 TaxID=3019544 RepID=UPI0022EBDD7C|nr:hypothetical protein [Hyphomicrobium sp. DMF-1]WBT40132.1 hypothetical protein PE058_09690 [Hyphomicrobium sp. DMF-1]
MTDTQEDVIERARSKVAHLDEAMKDMADEITSLRSQNKRMREALVTAAVRFDLLASDIGESHAISGTLRAERTIRAKNFALEVMAALSHTSKDETPQ